MEGNAPGNINNVIVLIGAGSIGQASSETILKANKI